MGAALGAAGVSGDANANGMASVSGGGMFPGGATTCSYAAGIDDAMGPAIAGLSGAAGLATCGTTIDCELSGLVNFIMQMLIISIYLHF